MRSAHARKADEVVYGDREQTYDDPSRNFRRIAKAWEAVTDYTFTPEQVALMMTALKLVREGHRHQDDNLIDAHGYLMCLERIRTHNAETMADPAPGVSPQDMMTGYTPNDSPIGESVCNKYCEHHPGASHKRWAEGRCMSFNHPHTGPCRFPEDKIGPIRTGPHPDADNPSG